MSTASDETSNRGPEPAAEVTPPNGDTYVVGPEPEAGPRAVAPHDPPLELADEPPTQFSLGMMFLLMLLAAGILAPLRLLPLPVAAAAMGLVALVGMVLLAIVRPRAAWIYVVWWFLVAVYLAVCVFAMLAPRG